MTIWVSRVAVHDPSRRYAGIAVMETTHYRNGNQFCRPGKRCCVNMRDGSIAAEALMWTGHMVVFIDVIPEQPLKMRAAQYDDMIEQLAPQYADEPLDEWILPRTSIGGANFLDATAIQKCPHSRVIDAVIVAEEATGLLAERHGLPQLMNHPVH